MTAPILEIADEVVTHVNDALVSQAVTTGGPSIQPDRPLERTSGLAVVVYPARNVSETDLTRKLRQHEYDLKSWFRPKLGRPIRSSGVRQIDALIGLVDALAEGFRSGEPLPATHAIVCLRYRTNFQLPKHLDQRNVFFERHQPDLSPGAFVMTASVKIVKRFDRVTQASQQLAVATFGDAARMTRAIARNFD